MYSYFVMNNPFFYTKQYEVQVSACVMYIKDNKNLVSVF